MFQVDDHRFQQAWEDATDEELWGDQDSICWFRDVYHTPNHRTMCEMVTKEKNQKISKWLNRERLGISVGSDELII